jgi:tRNA threonylcarbamoyladenosine biosynthesis protein TsaB
MKPVQKTIIDLIIHRAYNLAINCGVSNNRNFSRLRGRRGRSFITETFEDKLITLGIDTATEKRSVAVMRGEILLSLRVCGLREGGATNVLSEIERALEDASVVLEDIGLFAASCGPGSFTGLRAGLATLKGLALTLGRPVVGVPTLHAAARAQGHAGSFLALIPAGRGELFAQFLQVDDAGEVEENGGARHISPGRLAEVVSGAASGLKLAGGGAYKFLEAIGGHKGAEGLRLAVDSVAPEGAEGAGHASEALAPSVAKLARARYLRGEVTSAEGLRAIYVRPSDAELNER